MVAKVLISNLVLLVCNLGLLTALPVNTTRNEIGDTRNFNIPDHILSDGYHTEIHHVVTEDGYILEVHRIPYSRGQTSSSEPRTPVFVMHGLMGNSFGFVQMGPEASFAYNLVNSGFDVWMGNARGNSNSRFHVTLDPDHAEERYQFWDLCWEDIGMKDIPAMIDYVLENTGRDKLHYIGHSQGGTVFLVMNSMRPEYNDKIISAHLLAGVGNMEYFPNQPLVQLSRLTNTLYPLSLRIGLLEITTPNFTLPTLPTLPNITWPLPTTALTDCSDEEDLGALCGLPGLRFAREGDETDDTEVPFLAAFGGAAMKQIAHYGQNIDAKLFMRWDYGTEGNLEAYGTETAPLFNLSLITVNTTMHYSMNDNLLDERDVLDMVEVMPNTVARRVSRESFAHSDYLEANDAKELVTDFIIEAISYAETAYYAEREVDTGVDNGNNSSSTISLSILIKIFLLIYSLH